MVEPVVRNHRAWRTGCLLNASERLSGQPVDLDLASEADPLQAGAGKVAEARFAEGAHVVDTRSSACDQQQRVPGMIQGVGPLQNTVTNSVAASSLVEEACQLASEQSDENLVLLVASKKPARRTDKERRSASSSASISARA